MGDNQVLILIYFLIFIAIVIGINLLLKNYGGWFFEKSFVIKKKIEFIISFGLIEKDERQITISLKIEKTEGFLELNFWTPFISIDWNIFEEADID